MVPMKHNIWSSNNVVLEQLIQFFVLLVWPSNGTPLGSRDV
jgi:hypothetical protein